MNRDKQPPFRLPPDLASRGTELIDSWKFIARGGALAIGLLLARAFGVL